MSTAARWTDFVGTWPLVAVAYWSARISPTRLARSPPPASRAGHSRPGGEANAQIRPARGQRGTYNVACHLAHQPAEVVPVVVACIHQVIAATLTDLAWAMCSLSPKKNASSAATVS